MDTFRIESLVPGRGMLLNFLFTFQSEILSFLRALLYSDFCDRCNTRAFERLQTRAPLAHGLQL